MENKDNKLTYVEYKGCKDVLTIDLHNSYTVIAIKSWNTESKSYSVEFRLKENTVEKWDLIDEASNVVFNVDYRIINKAILKHVATLLSCGFFDGYIKRYEYELKCFDKGIEFFERKQIDIEKPFISEWDYEDDLK